MALGREGEGGGWLAWVGPEGEGLCEGAAPVLFVWNEETAVQEGRGLECGRKGGEHEAAS